MRIILLGPPGAGKGTQAQYLCNHYQIPHISTGNMLRTAISEGTEVGRKAEAFINKGQLVPDGIIIDVVKERIKAQDCEKGFLLDGFPRTIAQAQAMKDNKIKIDTVLEISVPADKILERMTGRLTHLASGRVYHKIANPQKNEGLDDITGEPLVQREDDKPETVSERLTVYERQTRPLVEYYQAWEKNEDSVAPRYLCVSGIGSVEEVSQRIQASF